MYLVSLSIKRKRRQNLPMCSAFKAKYQQQKSFIGFFVVVVNPSICAEIPKVRGSPSKLSWFYLIFHRVQDGVNILPVCINVHSSCGLGHLSGTHLISLTPPDQIIIFTGQLKDKDHMKKLCQRYTFWLILCVI